MNIKILIGLLFSIFFPSTVCAEIEAPPIKMCKDYIDTEAPKGCLVDYVIDSGIHDNTTENPKIVFSHIINIEKFSNAKKPWTFLWIKEANISKGSVLRIIGDKDWKIDIPYYSFLPNKYDTWPEHQYKLIRLPFGAKGKMITIQLEAAPHSLKNHFRAEHFFVADADLYPTGEKSVSFDPGYVIEGSHINPKKLASLIDLTLREFDLGNFSTTTKGNITIIPKNVNLKRGIASIKWGDSSDSNIHSDIELLEKDTLEHKYTDPGTYESSLAVINEGDFCLYKWTVNVVENNEEIEDGSLDNVVKFTVPTPIPAPYIPNLGLKPAPPLLKL